MLKAAFVLAAASVAVGHGVHAAVAADTLPGDGFSSHQYSAKPCVASAATPEQLANSAVQADCGEIATGDMRQPPPAVKHSTASSAPSGGLLRREIEVQSMAGADCVDQGLEARWRGLERPGSPPSLKRDPRGQPGPDSADRLRPGRRQGPAVGFGTPSLRRRLRSSSGGLAGPVRRTRCPSRTRTRS